MFGHGLYFADRAKKSLGYTSLRGSYWARGCDSRGFLCLYDVHIGNQYKIKKHDICCYDLNYDKLRELGNYDSVFAEKGYDLVNNEYIVYKEEQSTIRFILQIGD